MLALLPALAYAQDVCIIAANVQFTVAETIQNSPRVATRTIIITAPIDEITSIADSIPTSVVQLQQSAQGGQILPITVNDYVTSILIPAAASIPTGITLSPISPVLVPVPTVVSAVSNNVDAGASSVSSVIASGKRTASHKRSDLQVPTEASRNRRDTLLGDLRSGRAG